MTTSAKNGRVIATGTGTACLLALAACGQEAAPATNPDRLSSDTSINEAAVPTTAPNNPPTLNRPPPNQLTGWCKTDDLRMSTGEGRAAVHTTRRTPRSTSD